MTMYDPLPLDMRHCRLCGCSDLETCEGGCEWVEDDLCSRCAEPHRARVFGRQVA